jgi:hypothetical protein
MAVAKAEASKIIAAVIAATTPTIAESRDIVSYNAGGNYQNGKQKYIVSKLVFMAIVVIRAMTTLYGIFKLVQRVWREMSYEVLFVRKTTMQAKGVQAEVEESSWDKIIVVGRFETEVYHHGKCSALAISRLSKKLRRCLKCIGNPKDD